MSRVVDSFLPAEDVRLDVLQYRFPGVPFTTAWLKIVRLQRSFILCLALSSNRAQNDLQRATSSDRLEELITDVSDSVLRSVLSGSYLFCFLTRF